MILILIFSINCNNNDKHPNQLSYHGESCSMVNDFTLSYAASWTRSFNLPVDEIMATEISFSIIYNRWSNPTGVKDPSSFC